jgi:hypothetical protein
VCVRFPCVHAVATTPAQRLEALLCSLRPSRVSLPRYGSQVGLCIVLFEACSAFTRVTACTLALSPIRDTHSEGFSYFVTSIAAPVASGWSSCRVGLTPTGKRRLCTAHARRRRSAMLLGGCPHDLLDAPLVEVQKTPRQNDGCSENIQVVASHHRAFIQLPDFIQQHVFRVWNCDATAGVGPVIEHQQSGVHSVRKLRQLFR